MKWFFFLGIWISTSLFSHPLDMGLLLINEVETGLKVSLEMNPSVVAAWIEGDSKPFSDNDFLRLKEIWFQKSLEKAFFSNKGGTCLWFGETSVIVNGPQSVGLSKQCQWKKEGNTLTLDSQFWRELPPSFHLLVRWESSGSVQLKSLDAMNPKIDWETNSSSHSLISFIQSGLEHIGVTPNQWWTGAQLRFPDGIDHILFVVALIFSSGGWIEILKMITGFTLGHSITLALSTLGWIQLSPQWIEPVIALSIAFVAAKAIFAREKKGNWIVASGFGLVHGLGFATGLSNFYLSSLDLVRALLGFNLGVELGQATIILFVFPIAYAMKNRSKIEKTVVPIVNLGILILGSYWFIKRCLGLGV